MDLRRAAILAAFVCGGCATLFGWDIHAPGVLSEDFYRQVSPAPARVALYLPASLGEAVSKDRGSAMSDPQTYHVGEALRPMLLEAFQHGFEEFVLMEAEPTPERMRAYGIPCLAAVTVTGFDNRKGRPLNRQVVELVTETTVFNDSLEKVVRFESRGRSDARRVFAKRGGPEVNLNAAVENNVLAIVQFLQDGLRAGKWR